MVYNEWFNKDDDQTQKEIFKETAWVSINNDLKFRSSN